MSTETLSDYDVALAFVYGASFLIEWCLMLKFVRKSIILTKSLTNTIQQRNSSNHYRRERPLLAQFSVTK